MTFWTEQANLEPCCQTSDDEVLEGDADQFDCNQCPLMEAYDGLQPENREAWGLFKRLCSRFTHEFHVVPVLMERAIAEMEFDDAVELSQRLSVIYDGLYPPKPEKH